MTTYMNVSLSEVAEYITPSASSVASAIRTLNGNDPEVDMMVLLKTLYEQASKLGMHSVAAPLEEAFDNAYTAFVNNNFVDNGDDSYEYDFDL